MEWINTKTIEEFKKVLEILDKKWWKTEDWKKALSIVNHWYCYWKYTVVSNRNDIVTGHIQWDTFGHRIISFEDFINREKEEKEVFEIGEEVKTEVYDKKTFYTWWKTMEWEYIVETKDGEVFSCEIIEKIPTITIEYNWKHFKINRNKAKELWII